MISKGKSSLFQGLLLTVYTFTLLIIGVFSYFAPVFLVFAVGILLIAFGHLYFLFKFYDIVIKEGEVSIKNLIHNYKIINKESILLVGRKDFIVTRFFFVDFTINGKEKRAFFFLEAKTKLQSYLGKELKEDEFFDNLVTVFK